MKIFINPTPYIILLLLGHPSFANESETLEKNANRLLQQEQLREQVRTRKSKQDVFFGRPKKQAAIESAKPQKCFAIDTINILDSNLIKPKVKNQLISNYKSHCLSTNHINNLINDIGNLYLSSGYVTSRAFIKEQNLNDGILDITVVEGKINDILIVPKNINKKVVKTAFPNVKGKYLNLRDIEMGIEQINRLQSQSAKSSLIPGQRQGETDLQVEIKKTKPIYFGVTLDNHGSEGTGKYLISSNLTWDNPFGINDTLTVGLNGSSKQASEKGSRGNSFSYEVPYGYSLFDFSYSTYNYRQPIIGLNQNFQSKGVSNNYKLGVDRIVFRNKNSKTKLTFKVGHKASKNFISDQLINTSSRKLTIGTLKLGHTKLFSDGSLNVHVSMDRGLTWFGAERNLGEDNPKAQFKKYTVGLDYSKQKTMFGQSYNFNTNANFQYASDKLYGTEQISIGGLHTVRGFAKNGLSGKTGWYWRNEISTSSLDALGSKITPYIAYDIGHIQKDSSSGNGGTLSGGGVGLRTQGKYLKTDISVLRANVKPNDFEEDTIVSASISLNF